MSNAVVFINQVGDIPFVPLLGIVYHGRPTFCTPTAVPGRSAALALDWPGRVVGASTGLPEISDGLDWRVDLSDAFRGIVVALDRDPRPRGRADLPSPPGPHTVNPTSVQVGQVRGVLAERVVINTALDPFLTLKALVAYSGIGLRKLYEYLADPVHPLPHYRVGGKILVRRSEFDAWIAAYRRIGGSDINGLANGVLAAIAR